MRRAALVLVLAASLGAAIPANGWSATEPDHAAGSQIALHEGTVTFREGPPVADQPVGLDVSGHQKDVDWPAVARAGATFAYVKATESTTYTNPYFAKQYKGAYQAGLTRGAYHFALPDRSDGTAQANFFVDNGGRWAADGRTLPPALDMEYNPYGPTCYGLTPAQMVGWVRAFSDRVKARTGRHPMIYTSTAWWAQCTGDSPDFGATNPLWIPRYGSSLGRLPAGWNFHSIWQFADQGPLPGDQNRFNGTATQLRALAKG
jgi:GH25 family lysozyme M1 (1,4-beta-N-acetylmuramidase)